MISNTSVSSGGNKTKGGGGGGTLRISTTYQPHLTSDEHRPKVKIWISFDHHHKNSGDRWTLTRKLYSPGNRQRQDFKQFFDIPLPSDKELAAFPLDAAVHFQVYAKMTDSHAGGNDPEENFEKDGSGKLYLAQLFAGNHGHATTKSIGVPLSLQSCIIENPKPVRKGRFVIRLEKQGTLLKRQLVFAAPSLSDVVPGNMKNLQGIIYTLIQRNLIIFDKKIMKAARVTFELTLAEGDRVHAPLWVNSTGLIIPGGYYFGNTSQHGTEWDEGFFSQILEISISRAGWTSQRYTKTIEAQHGAATTEKPAWSEYLTALRITWQSLTILSNSLPYIADLAEGDDRRKKVVESFDDALSRNADDCEGVAELIDRAYRGLRDGTNFTKSHVLAGQSVIRLYKPCGALGTVTSRNIDEASETDQGKPEVGSQRDLSGETGAHMTIVATPRVYFWEMLGRTTSDISKVMEHSEPAFVPRHPVTGNIVRQAWEKKLPVMIAEGTGGFRCTSRAEEAEFETRIEKKAAILRTLKLREAYSRLLTGLGPDQRNRMDRNELRMLAGFDGMQILRMQDALVNNPNVRLNTFFRLQTELFPCPERHEELFQARPDATGLGLQDPTSSGPSDPYSLRKIIPVQMGPRKGGAAGNLQQMTAGVNMVDIVNKQSFVGAIRLTKAHSLEIKAIQSSADHLPPEEELKLPSRQDVEKKQKIFRALASAFGGSISRTGKLSAEAVLQSTTAVFVYWRLKKFGGVTQARQLGQSMRGNALVMEAELHLDHVAEGVATVRLQARLVTSDMLKLNPKVVDKLLGPQVSSFPEMKKSVSAAAKIGSTKKTRAKIQRSTKSLRYKKGRIALSLKEIEALELRTNVQGKMCLKNLLVSARTTMKPISSPFGSNGEKEEEEDVPSGTETAMTARIIRASLDVGAVNSATILSTTTKMIDVTRVGNAIRVMDETEVESPVFAEVICEAYAKLRGLMDYLWALFVTNGQTDAAKNARVFNERLKSCRTVIASFGSFPLAILRAIIGSAMPIIEWLEKKMMDVYSFVGGLLGTTTKMLVEQAKKTGEYLKPIARTATRLAVFSSASMAILQTAMLNPARKKMDTVLLKIIETFRDLLLNFKNDLFRHTDDVTVFLSKVWTRVAETTIWAGFTNVAERAYELFGEVSGALKIILKWLISFVSFMGPSIIFILMGITAPVSYLLNIMGDSLIGNDKTFTMGFPMTDEQREALVDALMLSKHVVEETKVGLTKAREAFRLDELTYMTEMGEKMMPKISEGVLKQVMLAWALSAEVAGWIVDGVRPEPTPGTLRIAREYLGFDLLDISNIDTTPYRDYVWWILKALSKEAPAEKKKQFVEFLLENNPRLSQKETKPIIIEAELSPIEMLQTTEHFWLQRNIPTPNSYQHVGGEDEEEEEGEELGEEGQEGAEAAEIAKEELEKMFDLAQEFVNDPASFALMITNWELFKDLSPELRRFGLELMIILQKEPWRITKAQDPGIYKIPQERRRLIWSMAIGVIVFGVIAYLAKTFIDDQARRRKEEENFKMTQYWFREASADDQAIVSAIFKYHNRVQRDPAFVTEGVGVEDRLKEEVIKRYDDRMRKIVYDKKTKELESRLFAVYQDAAAERAGLGREAFKSTILPLGAEEESTHSPRTPDLDNLLIGPGSKPKPPPPTSSFLAGYQPPPLALQHPDDAQSDPATESEYSSQKSFTSIVEHTERVSKTMSQIKNDPTKLNLQSLEPGELRDVIWPVFRGVMASFRERHTGSSDLIKYLKAEDYFGSLLATKLFEPSDAYGYSLLAKLFGRPELVQGSDISHASEILKNLLTKAMLNFEEHVEADRRRWYLTILQMFWKVIGFTSLGIPSKLLSAVPGSDFQWENLLSLTWKYTPAVYSGIFGYALTHNLVSAIFRMWYWRSSKEIWLQFARNMKLFGFAYFFGPVAFGWATMSGILSLSRYMLAKIFWGIKRTAVTLRKETLSTKGITKALAAGFLGGPAAAAVVVVAGSLMPSEQAVSEHQKKN